MWRREDGFPQLQSASVSFSQLQSASLSFSQLQWAWLVRVGGEDLKCAGVAAAAAAVVAGNKKINISPEGAGLMDAPWMRDGELKYLFFIRYEDKYVEIMLNIARISSLWTRSLWSWLRRCSQEESSSCPRSCNRSVSSIFEGITPLYARPLTRWRAPSWAGSSRGRPRAWRGGSMSGTRHLQCQIELATNLSMGPFPWL